MLKENTTQRLFQQLHQDDDPNWRRTAGGMHCWLCLSQYRKHPMFDEQTYFGHPVDYRLCNGDVVHL
jgi:hypothetical protein